MNDISELCNALIIAEDKIGINTREALEKIRDLVKPMEEELEVYRETVKSRKEAMGEIRKKLTDPVSKSYSTKETTAELDKYQSDYNKKLRNLPTFVSIDQFIDDEEYLGKIWGGVYEEGNYKGCTKVYPFWRRKLCEIYNANVPFPINTVKLYGNIGAGRTTAMTIGLLYDLYKLIKTDDLHARFNIPAYTTIAVAYYKIRSMFGGQPPYYFNTIMHESPFFKSHIKKITRDRVVFTNRIEVHFVASIPQDTLGISYIAYVADEGTCVIEKILNTDDHKNLLRRIVSRFAILNPYEHSTHILPVKCWEIYTGENPDVASIGVSIKDVQSALHQ